MRDYVIYTDSGCDISPALLAEWGVPYKSLTFRFNGEEKEYENGEMDVKEFYDRMRAGGVAKTAAINKESFAIAFREIVKGGKDILYIGFSSGLSTTCNSARLAAEEVSAEYPDAKILVVDTLAASAGQGLLVYLAMEKKAEGATLEQCAAYIEEIKLNMCHWFTVDDLVYLKRGGRVSATAAFFGNALGIKPVMHVDNEGHLVNVMKVRGRRTAINTMADKLVETALDAKNGKIYISHGDCREDADYLATLIAEKCGGQVEIITDVGAVIGAHSGPGTLALFFLGRER
ncbi:MAG: DegV family protein [Clostridia bacterium]|nr:DegV family protein [Clostridia bacterium]